MPAASFCPECPKCGNSGTRVVTTMRTDDGLVVRRRRCVACDHRFYGLQQLEQIVPNWRLKFKRNALTSGGVLITLRPEAA